MFERRLKVFVGVFGLGLVIIVVRLVELQAVKANYYRSRAERSLLQRPRVLPFVRGRILDRTGAVLVSDQPSWELTVDYAVLAADVGEGDARDAAMRALLRRYSKRYPAAGGEEQRAEALADEITSMWFDISRLSIHTQVPLSVDALREEARNVYDRVQRISRAVERRRGFPSPVAEERMAHAIVERLDASAQIAARERLADYPWVHVEPSSARLYADDASSLAHVLGRMGRVDADAISSDPRGDDPFARYRADSQQGITGVECAAEDRLRGRRGQVLLDRQGNIVEDVAAENGRDVILTIDGDLQQRLYRLLGETVQSTPASSGGAIVVLDVARRDVLALVSYPAYDPNLFDQLYPLLRDDTDRLPLRFRAVRSAYAPGSTVKPLVCLAGLMSGTIDLNTRETCTGYLFEDVHDRWRCWPIHGTSQRMAHGPVNVTEALTGSCNIFMYRLGERLGIDGLCSVFDMAGLGKRSGIGLREEVKGVNPTPAWLATERNTPVYPAHARLFAIGQGEMLMTPVQVANLMATYASGRYRPVTLFPHEEPTPEWTLPASSEQWRAIRRGIYGVVNDPAGTAYRHAHFERDGYVICGKTGSATVYPWPTAYRVPYTDAAGVNGVATIRAGALGPAIDRFERMYPDATFDPSAVEVASRWPPVPPPEGQRHSHAWFGAYLQAVDAAGIPDWSREPRVAFAVLVEFGGSGGRTSGPLAKRVADALLDRFGPTLVFDQVGSEER